LAFKATSGGAIDEGPAFYAPQVLAEPDRTLLWAWAWELDRSDQQVADAGWAGVLTFPREVYVADDALRARPAAELAGLRRARLEWRPGAPIHAHAFELVASGPVALRLIDRGANVLVATGEGTEADPARILVDGSIIETFHRGVSRTTRAYPTLSSRWVAEGGAVTVFRLGGMVPDWSASDMQPSREARARS
jgi:beta-fructofuranosidase